MKNFQWTAAALAILLVGMTTQLTTRSSADPQAAGTKALLEKADQCLDRTQLLIQDAESRLQSRSGHVGLRQSKQMSESLAAMATSIKQLIVVTDQMLQNDALLKDPEISRDLQGVRGTLEYQLRSLENTLQYMEHLNYKLGQTS
jgi:hypothetical protein